MKADAKTTAEVQAAIRKFMDAYESRNLQGVMGCMATDADVVLFGTGADEKRIGPEQARAQVERDWAQTESLAVSLAWTSISAAGLVAWMAGDGVVKARAGGQDMTLPVRISLVLESRGGKWLIVHSHFSTPAAGQEEGQSL